MYALSLFLDVNLMVPEALQSRIDILAECFESHGEIIATLKEFSGQILSIFEPQKFFKHEKKGKKNARKQESNEMGEYSVEAMVF
jgi:hypothetical protein